MLLYQRLHSLQLNEIVIALVDKPGSMLLKKVAGPKFITPWIFCQISEVMSGLFLTQCCRYGTAKKCKNLFFRYNFRAKKAQKWWKMAKFCVPLFRWPCGDFSLDLDISYWQILIPYAIGFRKFGNGLHRAIKEIYFSFIYFCRSTFFSKRIMGRKYCAN